jgi:hypothetical protein
MSGMLELRTFLARNAGLEFSADGKLRSRALPDARFKTRKNTKLEEVNAARSLATSCARLVSSAMSRPYSKLSDDPDLLRNRVLGNVHAWVSLPLLLEVCWSNGIPVVYLPELPVLGKKMDGMVTFVGQRPAIILTKKVPHPAWLLFLLAHEIGHIAKGHLLEVEGQAIVDDSVDNSEMNSIDVQETEASGFATRLLAPFGKEFRIAGRLPPPNRLASLALHQAKEMKMDPGYVILNAVHNSSINSKPPFGLAQNALKLLPSDDPRSVTEMCRDAASSHLNKSNLRDDTADFLEKLSVV